MPIEYSEKRDFIRMSTDHVMSFKEVGAEELNTGTCVNLSATGVMFKTQRPVAQGARLEISIAPGYAVVDPFNAIIEVIRTAPSSESAGDFEIAGKITALKQ
jgi:hypothetical protein